MKKILKSLDFEEVTAIDYITNDSIVAIKWSNKKVSVVVQCPDELFYGCDGHLSSRFAWSRKSKREYVEAAFNQGAAQAFEFNSYKELYGWLATQ
jgi:hypothetical protein